MNFEECCTAVEHQPDYSGPIGQAVVRSMPQPHLGHGPSIIMRSHLRSDGWEFLGHGGSSSSISDDVDIFVGLERTEDRLISEIEDFRDLCEGWDGEDAAKPNAKAIEQATRFVGAAGELANRLEPSLHVDGSVILEIGNGIEGSIRFMGDDRIIYSAIGIAPSVSRFDGRSVPEVIKIVLGS
jgi:hypothetical protein